MKLRSVCLALTLAVAAVPSLAWADKGDQAQVDPATRDKSRAAFKKGVSQLKAQDWAGARASFEEAYSLLPHPSILLNLGISRLKTDDPAGAEDALMKFLQEDAGAGPEELASARDALADARGKIGTIRLNVTPAGAKTTIDGKVATGTDVRVKAGSHTLTIEAEGFQSAEKQVDVPAKGNIEVQAVLAKSGAPGGEKPKDDKKELSTSDDNLRPILGYSLLGVSGVALIVTGVMAARAFSLSSDYSDQNKKETYQNADTKSSGITARTLADVSFIVALLAGAGAIVLLFTDIGKGEATPSATKPDAPKPDAPKPAEPQARLQYSFPATIRW
ncbi:MAG: PEGA domain-containing protein [Labilithrix sp.]